MDQITKKKSVNNRPTELAFGESAVLSMRTVSALEVISVTASVLITTWAIVPMQPPNKWVYAIPGLLALVLIINSQRLRKETLADIGLTFRHFPGAVKLLILPTIAGLALFISIGYLSGTYRDHSNFKPAMLLLPVWGIFQQYVLQGFIFRRIRFVLTGNDDIIRDRSFRISKSVLLTALIFSLVHAPNPALMILTFLGALVWSWVYERSPNLPALGLSHGIMSLLVITSLPPWMLQSMSVGYKHFMYQKF